jgi:tRNA A-37 threonylcarbamoyl transferase component Bud32
MDFSYLNDLSIEQIKKICGDLQIKPDRPKKELVRSITKSFREYEKYKKNTIDKYEKTEKLGTGKEGTTYLVKCKDGREYAMKCFKSNKSSAKMRLEAQLQTLASDAGISPKIYEMDTVSKYIVMKRMDHHLYDNIKNNNGLLKLNEQKQIVNILKKLDDIKVFHADSNILNYMYYDKKLYIIDFGMSKHIDDKLAKKLGTSTPNIDYGVLGLILKLKEFNCPAKSYEHFLKFVSEDNKKKFQL